jgi:hypothetical protein
MFLLLPLLLLPLLLMPMRMLLLLLLLLAALTGVTSMFGFTLVCSVDKMWSLMRLVLRC